MPPRCGNPASSKSSSGSSSNNPVSMHPKTKSIHIKKEIPKEDRIRTTIPGYQKCKGHSFETRISKCVTKKVRHCDQDDREADGAMHWNVKLPVLKGRFQNQLEKIHRRGLAPLPLSWKLQDEV